MTNNPKPGSKIEELRRVCDARTKERFISKVKKTKTCWIWVAGFRGEYGAFTFKPYTSWAHRASYLIYRGDIPENKLVLHTCDNKACVNPEHLYLGNFKDNARDAIERGQIATGKRHGRYTHPESRTPGDRNGNAKFSRQKIDKIRTLLKAGNSIKYLSIKYGVHFSTIWKIKKSLSYVN